MNGAAALLITRGEEIIIMGFELTDTPPFHIAYRIGCSSILPDSGYGILPIRTED